MRIGILGGTFDPVHAGHIFVAEEARIRLSLDQVLFIPAGNPWFKTDHGITSAKHRIEMVRLAIAKHEHFSISTIEVERGGPSYTVETLDKLLTTMGKNDYYLILGRDSFTELPMWKEPQRIIGMCTLVVVPRIGTNLPELEDVALRIEGLSREKVVTLDSPMIGISSSGIRERVAHGLPIDYLVPGAVENYIVAHDLYRRQGG
ncbi:MAG: nicotinate-nucleotide adenylyltransferase [Dehalococcoidia bacterium]|nr:nicotinate-nucleotide adenylyltransferase [Dehalococcoidia bacterium]